MNVIIGHLLYPTIHPGNHKIIVCIKSIVEGIFRGRITKVNNRGRHKYNLQQLPYWK